MFKKLAPLALALATASAIAAPASAQFMPGPFMGPPAYFPPPPPPVFFPPPPPPVFNPGVMNPGMPMGGGAFPGAGMLPRDGQIVMQIQQSCGGEPRCMAIAWGSIEVSRCRNGFFQEGGCFGPNGEIMKLANRVLPRNLQPGVIVGNIQNDIQNGPGENNDLVGKNGWACRTFFGGC